MLKTDNGDAHIYVTNPTYANIKKSPKLALKAKNMDLGNIILFDDTDQQHEDQPNGATIRLGDSLKSSTDALSIESKVSGVNSAHGDTPKVDYVADPKVDYVADPKGKNSKTVDSIYLPGEGALLLDQKSSTPTVHAINVKPAEENATTAGSGDNLQADVNSITIPGDDSIDGGGPKVGNPSKPHKKASSANSLTPVVQNEQFWNNMNALDNDPPKSFPTQKYSELVTEL
ncbi:unnamed protein product [Owenia fusiformis]|uniref:Uncharacterized protein n=1 Tax=Owenia fusiformis TaxID=6347 RepID=A0A8S4PQ69_OWEFU|nr:unnamed protein product [Owenia fusiformis]